MHTQPGDFCALVEAEWLTQIPDARRPHESGDVQGPKAVLARLKTRSSFHWERIRHNWRRLGVSSSRISAPRPPQAREEDGAHELVKECCPYQLAFSDIKRESIDFKQDQIR